MTLRFLTKAETVYAVCKSFRGETDQASDDSAHEHDYASLSVHCFEEIPAKCLINHFEYAEGLLVKCETSLVYECLYFYDKVTCCDCHQALLY